MGAEPEGNRRALPPGVVQLNSDLLVLRVDVFDELAQGFYLGVVPEPKVLWCAAPLWRDARTLDEAEARSEGRDAAD